MEERERGKEKGRDKEKVSEKQRQEESERLRTKELKEKFQNTVRKKLFDIFFIFK